MRISGENFLGHTPSAAGKERFESINPATGAALGPQFVEATTEEIDRAVKLADAAVLPYRNQPITKIADFLAQIGVEIDKLGDALLERASAETGLPLPRLTGERARTIGQLNMFAALVRDGSAFDARIDHALPDRKPLPKPDVRRVLEPIGPVVVFGASNFPLAFSTAGGDTASALAARNPVVVKAHPSHAGTSELVARAILEAAKQTGMPDGVFSLVHGATPAVGVALIQHPLVQAVGFTGSLSAGRAIFNAASARPNPIPVHAEMGSINPMFLLPGALKGKEKELAAGFQSSLTMGVGQFCTNPGLVVAVAGESLTTFIEETSKLVQESAPGTMLNRNICNSYETGVGKLSKAKGVQAVATAKTAADRTKTQAAANLFVTTASAFLSNPELQHEVFGPSSLVVQCETDAELELVAQSLAGQLTAVVFASETECTSRKSLFATLTRKVGRLIVNQYPTGVEVCPSMNHGGPYPATTDARFTSVGTAAIQRFLRPLSYQGFPDAALPAELQEGNPLGIRRLVDGKY